MLECFAQMYGKQSEHRMWLELIVAATRNADLPVFMGVGENGFHHYF